MESMKELEAMLEASFRPVKKGDLVTKAITNDDGMVTILLHIRMIIAHSVNEINWRVLINQIIHITMEEHIGTIITA